MKGKKLLLGLVSVSALALTLAVFAFAASTASTHIKATLDSAQEVPKPSVKAPGGTGSFTASLSGSKLTWKLVFGRLTGPAVAAHIHLGRPGKAGGVAVSLCGPCKSGVSGTATLTSAQKKALLGGGTYVNVHTAKNSSGEIRGQISKTAGTSASNTPPPAPPTTTTTTKSYGY